MLDHVPGLDSEFAARLALERYGIDGTVRPLPSERDQNFLIEGASGVRLVLKIANALESPAMLDAQQRAMAHLAHSEVIAPRVIITVGGCLSETTVGPDGRRHVVWAVSHLPGAPLASVRHRSKKLLDDFGRCVGELANGLRTFDHPAIHRAFYWDLSQGRQVIEQHRALVENAVLGAAIDTLVSRFDAEVSSRLETLPRSAIHGDLNDHNVLVDAGDGDPFARYQRISGIVDFGDMVHSWTVGDLAIAAAYVVLGAADPLAAMVPLVRGYHAVRPLNDDELAALFGLTGLRLCTSVCIAAHQRQLRPENAYLGVSQQSIQGTLPAVARIPFRLAEAVLRDACGLEPVPGSARVRTWLSAHTADFAPVLETDLRTTPCTVLDLSVESALIAGDPRANTEPPLTERVFAAMRDAGVRIGVGRYDEPRLLYTAPFFASGPRLSDERRTIHIGLDLFALAGTPVHAPLDGVVHAFADNHVLQDYGPVIILRHATDDGTEFFTLYGHLSRDSLHGLEIGQRVVRGQRFATFGTPEENVGWTPHLHLQLITDLLGFGTDFPGVGRASERSVWRSLSPDPNLLVGIPAERFPAARPARETTMAQRRERIGRNVSVAYREPLRIARGWMQYLFDDEGRRYLDAYNNVPHVGHSHPRVVRAGQAQMAILNTNTRYLHDLLGEYSGRLTATLPAPLRVCYFVNSASEANELALRLARAHTRRRDMIVLEAAYHGNTNALIDISPYKHAGPGGGGAPSWVHVAPLPDDYRGLYRRSEAAAGAKYAKHVSEIVDTQRSVGAGIAGFIAESCPSVGGQIMLPQGYLKEVYRAVRAAGGVCIADEVQTGLGRIGTHFWAFEAQGVVPDIVVMGKPLGNGHPMAAVVTTREIADSFDTGMEFFSTFGGNQVSCAIGLAVLDVVHDERLQEHALRVGDRMLRALRPLIERYPLVGDVRGSGLFLGVELVRDRVRLDPAPAEASYVVNRMREEGILLGTDGPHHNVVKIRPPMPFDDANADLLVETLERIVAEELE